MSFITYMPLLFQGTAITLGSWLIAGAISLILGLVFGVMSCRQLGSKFLKSVIRVYTFIAKGVPAYVQILIAYFVLPNLIGVNISGFWAAVGALAFCSSGYVTEIVRGGFNAIADGQWEACWVLGCSLRTTLGRVILPQVLTNILPSLFGEVEQLLKSTALLATIGITELTRTGMNIISRELNPIPVYLSIAMVYLLLAAVLQILMIYLENRKKYN